MVAQSEAPGGARAGLSPVVALQFPCGSQEPDAVPRQRYWSPIGCLLSARGSVARFPRGPRHANELAGSGALWPQRVRAEPALAYLISIATDTCSDGASSPRSRRSGTADVSRSASVGESRAWSMRNP